MKVPALHFAVKRRVESVCLEHDVFSCASFDVQQRQESYTVGDYMTPLNDLFVATKDTTIDEGGHW